MSDDIEGKKIVALRQMTKAELKREGWENEQGCMCLELEGGSILYPSRDEEGNGAGALFGFLDKETVMLWGK